MVISKAPGDLLDDASGSGFGIPGGLAAITALPGVPTVIAPRKERRRVTFNRNLSTFQQDRPELAIRSLIEHARDLQRAIDDIYSRTVAVPPEDLDADGFPRHGATCTALDGQYIHLVAPDISSTNLVAVGHGLERVPQGAITIYDENHIVPIPVIGKMGPRLIGEAIPVATREVIYFRWSTGAVEGDRTIVILF